MTEQGKKPLIPHRVLMVGEQQIPRQVLEDLGDHHMEIFMREPDPRDWPEEMRHLVEYLSVEERVGFLVSAVLARHDSQLHDILGQWSATVWEDIRQSLDLDSFDRELVVGEMIRHVSEVMSACARRVEEPDAEVCGLPGGS